MWVPFLYKTFTIYRRFVKKKVTNCVSVVLLRGEKHCSVVEITGSLVKNREISFWDQEVPSMISFEGHILYV